jgi:hypothetical protein
MGSCKQRPQDLERDSQREKKKRVVASGMRSSELDHEAAVSVKERWTIGLGQAVLLLEQATPQQERIQFADRPSLFTHSSLVAADFRDDQRLRPVPWQVLVPEI